MKRLTGRDFWEAAGEASDFDAEWKERVMKHARRVIERNGYTLGETILDIGSGVHPVSRFIAPKGSKVVYIDYNTPEESQRVEHGLHVKRDINDLLNKNSIAARRSIMESAKLLGIDPRTDSPQQVDTIILSDILNYVPAQQTLEKAYALLKPQGIFIIINQPGRTFDFARHTLDPEGATSNNALLETLIDHLNLTELYQDETRDGYFIGVFSKD